MRLKNSHPIKVKKKILLVDNEEDIGWILGKIMRDAGHKLIFASTYKDGMRKFKRLKKIDIAIIDLNLDEKDGLTFIEKAKAINNKVKFIMISVFGSPDVKAKARQLGVPHFLDKPFVSERLLEIINSETL